MHGVDIPMLWFYRTGPNPLDFLLHVAGFFGSDRCVDTGENDCFYIVQSNESFCKALTLAIKDAYKFDKTPTCCSSSTVSRNCFGIMGQIEKCHRKSISLRIRPSS